MNKLTFIAFLGLLALASTQTLTGGTDVQNQDFSSGGVDIPLLEIDNSDGQAAVVTAGILVDDPLNNVIIDYVSSDEEPGLDLMGGFDVEVEMETEVTSGILVFDPFTDVVIDYESSDDEEPGFDFIEGTEMELELEMEVEVTSGILVFDPFTDVVIDYDSSDEEVFEYEAVENLEEVLAIDFLDEPILVAPLSEVAPPAVILAPATPTGQDIIAEGLALKTENGEFVQIDGSEVEEDMEKIAEKGFLP